MVVSATARPVCHLEFIQKTDFGGRLMGKFYSSLDFTTRQLDAKTCKFTLSEETNRFTCGLAVIGLGNTLFTKTQPAV